MRIRELISTLAAFAFFATLATAQETSPVTTPATAVPATTTDAPMPRPATVIVTLQTALGPIVLELEKERAPITTRNFLRYVDEKRLDGATFYRAVNMGENYGLVQGGVQNAQKLLPPIAHEPTSKTGLSHQTGTVSMARGAEGTARSDFFIVVGDMSALDAHPEKPGDNSGFAAFGHVLEGMDVVMRMKNAPISPTLGAENGMQGQMLASPVKILSARHTPDYVAKPQAAAKPSSKEATPQ